MVVQKKQLSSETRRTLCSLYRAMLESWRDAKTTRNDRQEPDWDTVRVFADFLEDIDELAMARAYRWSIQQQSWPYAHYPIRYVAWYRLGYQEWTNIFYESALGDFNTTVHRAFMALARAIKTGLIPYKD